MSQINADLHNHLGRKGSFPSFNYVIDVAEKNLGKGGVFVIANCSYEGRRYEKFAEAHGYERENLGNAIYIHEKDILVVKGHEISDSKGHLVVVGLPKNKNIKSENFNDIVKESKKEHDAIIIAAHPFYDEGIGHFLWEKMGPTAYSMLEKLDGWEVYNGSSALWVPGVSLKEANKKSLEYYNEFIRDKEGLNIGMLSCTDGHSVNVIGRCHTEIPKLDIKNSETIINSLREGIRKTYLRDLEGLVMKQNMTDSFIHAAYMIKDMLIKS